MNLIAANFGFLILLPFIEKTKARNQLIFGAGLASNLDTGYHGFQHFGEKEKPKKKSSAFHKFSQEITSSQSLL
jgi:hypothetical protein